MTKQTNIIKALKKACLVKKSLTAWSVKLKLLYTIPESNNKKLCKSRHCSYVINCDHRTHKSKRVLYTSLRHSSELLGVGGGNN